MGLGAIQTWWLGTNLEAKLASSVGIPSLPLTSWAILCKLLFFCLGVSIYKAEMLKAVCYGTSWRCGKGFDYHMQMVDKRP